MYLASTPDLATIAGEFYCREVHSRRLLLSTFIRRQIVD